MKERDIKEYIFRKFIAPRFVYYKYNSKTKKKGISMDN